MTDAARRVSARTAAYDAHTATRRQRRGDLWGPGTEFFDGFDAGWAARDEEVARLREALAALVYRTPTCTACFRRDPVCVYCGQALGVVHTEDCPVRLARWVLNMSVHEERRRPAAQEE